MAGNGKNEGAAVGNDIAARTKFYYGLTSHRHVGMLDATAGVYKPTFSLTFPFTFATP